MVVIQTFTRCAYSGGAIFLTYALWSGLTGAWYYCLDIALWWITTLYYPQVYLNHIIRIIAARPYPNNCRSGFSNPSVESQLTYSFAAYVLAISIYKKKSIGKINSILLAGAVIYVTLALILSGDSSVSSVFIGAAIGVVYSILTLIIFKVYLDPLYKQASPLIFIRKLEYTDTLMNRNV